MKRDKARTITQRVMRGLISFGMCSKTWWMRGLAPFPSTLHHYDPVPIRRAVAPKRRRWRI